MKKNVTMNTKLVYVLTSNGHDEISAMLLMSLYSLRRYNQEMVAEVVMDTDTCQALTANNSAILQMAACNVVNVPAEYNVMQRSRYLKTNLRRIITGDFMYIDSDTIICDALEDLDHLSAELAMVPDQNNDAPQYDEGQLELNRQAGFDAAGQPYYNGGVILAKDTPLVHEFFDLWFDLWKQSLKRGVSKDQPALCEANKRLGHPIQVLNGVWNFQLLNRYLHFLPIAHIMHYWNIYEWKRLFVAQTAKTQRIDLLTALWLRCPRLSAFLLYVKRLVRYK